MLEGRRSDHRHRFGECHQVRETLDEIRRMRAVDVLRGTDHVECRKTQFLDVFFQAGRRFLRIGKHRTAVHVQSLDHLIGQTHRIDHHVGEFHVEGPLGSCCTGILHLHVHRNLRSSLAGQFLEQFHGDDRHARHDDDGYDGLDTDHLEQQRQRGRRKESNERRSKPPKDHPYRT